MDCADVGRSTNGLLPGCIWTEHVTLTVGITGGIGSGKSAVTAMLEKYGVTVVDADVAARIIVEPGKPALQAISRHFGTDILLADGTLNRAALRNHVFSDESARRWLEQLTHPLIGEEILSQLQASNSAYTVLSSPLLLETQQRKLADYIVVVDVPQEVQLQRTIARDDNDEAQVRRIMAAQMSRSDRLAQADIVIDNSQGLAALHFEVSQLHETLLLKSAEFRNPAGR
ncbi:MAG: dephospho-CoA kinase [Proteobacteria bacterium]|nr:dephospho-CoA kinase [Pseudomonadota bacterium]